MRPLTEEVRNLSTQPCVKAAAGAQERRVPGVQAGRFEGEVSAVVRAVGACVQELKSVLEKLFKFVGKNVKSLVEREDEAYCFRLHKNRVYHVREKLMKKATNVRHCTPLACPTQFGNAEQWH